LKKKDSTNIVESFQKLFKKTKRRPKKLWGDKDKAFYNKDFKDLLNSQGIKLYSTFSIKKAVYAELAVKHVKSKLYKHMSQKRNKNWINVLAQVTKSINDSYNISIGMSPSQVTEADQSVIWNRIYRKVIVNSPKKPKYKIGDRVRIGKTKIELGKKGFESYWSEEVFFSISDNKYSPCTIVSFRRFK
jgi:L-rhamnose mutarotase